MMRTQLPTTVLAAAALVALPAFEAVAQPVPLRLGVDEAIARGIETSHRLAEVRARERGARAAVREAGAADAVTAVASAGYMRTNHVPEFAVVQPTGGRLVVFPDIPDNFTTRLSVQWPIYTSGRVDALERAARAEADAVSAELDAARADLRFEIVRAYWAVATAEGAVRVIRESVARADAHLNDARQRFAVGLAPPNEVSSLQAQRSREQAQLIETTNLRDATLVDLRRLVGVPADTPVELTDSLDASSATPAAVPGADAAIGQALEHRAERKALTLRIGGAEAREQAALAAVKPTVAVGGSADWANPNTRIFPRRDDWRSSWDLGVNVSWPVLDGGRARAQALAASAQAEAARERLAEFDALVAADVRQRALDIESSLAVVAAASDAVASAGEARRVVADRFAAGVATATDVIVAEVAMLEAGLARTRALANVRVAEARLQRAMGRM